MTKKKIDEDALGFPGMTLRDWFAGQIVNGWISTYGASDNFPDPGRRPVVAANAYAMADAMLAERAKKAENPDQ